LIDLLTTATATDEAEREAAVALSPVGTGDTRSGGIGRPSLATDVEGAAVRPSLARSFKPLFGVLTEADDSAAGCVDEVAAGDERFAGGERTAVCRGTLPPAR
jgi:hypothetical protein